MKQKFKLWIFTLDTSVKIRRAEVLALKAGVGEWSSGLALRALKKLPGAGRDLRQLVWEHWD